MSDGGGDGGDDEEYGDEFPVIGEPRDDFLESAHGEGKEKPP